MILNVSINIFFTVALDISQILTPIDQHILGHIDTEIALSLDRDAQNNKETRI